MSTTSAGALGTPNLPRLDLSNISGTVNRITPTPASLDDTTIAKIAHQVNKAWCEFNGDTSQPDWDEAPEWQKTSALDGVAFHRNNPQAGDDASHNNWMEDKVAKGWIYGKVKDPEASPPTHPCIVPFEELPRDQQFKDVLFRTIVRAAID